MSQNKSLAEEPHQIAEPSGELLYVLLLMLLLCVLKFKIYVKS